MQYIYLGASAPVVTGVEASRGTPWEERPDSVPPAGASTRDRPHKVFKASKVTTGAAVGKWPRALTQTQSTDTDIDNDDDTSHDTSCSGRRHVPHSGRLPVSVQAPVPGPMPMPVPMATYIRAFPLHLSALTPAAPATVPAVAPAARIPAVTLDVSFDWDGSDVLIIVGVKLGTCVGLRPRHMSTPNTPSHAHTCTHIPVPNHFPTPNNHLPQLSRSTSYHASATYTCTAPSRWSCIGTRDRISSPSLTSGPTSAPSQLWICMWHGQYQQQRQNPEKKHQRGKTPLPSFPRHQ